MRTQIHWQRCRISQAAYRDHGDVMDGDGYGAEIGVLAGILPVRPERDILHAASRTQRASVTDWPLDNEVSHQPLQAVSTLKAETLQLFITYVGAQLCEFLHCFLPVEPRLLPDILMLLSIFWKFALLA